MIIGGVGFGVRTEAESRMRTECRETTGSGGDSTIIEGEHERWLREAGLSLPT